MQLPPLSPVVILPTLSAATHPHPSQGILATSTSGVACLVYYLYGAAQAVALAARAKRSLVPGASSSSSLDGSRMCKVYDEYEICNMQREGPAGWAGFESMFIDWKPPPPIPDWLSDVLPGRVWGFFTFYELELSRLLLWWLI